MTAIHLRMFASLSPRRWQVGYSSVYSSPWCQLAGAPVGFGQRSMTSVGEVGTTRKVSRPAASVIAIAQFMTRALLSAQSRTTWWWIRPPWTFIRSWMIFSGSTRIFSRSCCLLLRAVMSPPRALKVGSFSIRVTAAPASAAERAAASPATPAPTTTTSVSRVRPISSAGIGGGGTSNEYCFVSSGACAVAMRTAAPPSASAATPMPAAVPLTNPLLLSFISFLSSLHSVVDCRPRSGPVPAHTDARTRGGRRNHTAARRPFPDPTPGGRPATRGNVTRQGRGGGTGSTPGDGASHRRRNQRLTGRPDPFEPRLCHLTGKDITAARQIRLSKCRYPVRGAGSRATGRGCPLREEASTPPSPPPPRSACAAGG
ncbi:MAG: hypothetical protein BWX64_02705 [Acidobacteria bacterium ADurb.Bin051]|nr:MAG: hypothetical protein BWX64_02705 [Acidobacteria bacterium ADurb.Bin051]